jgi:predicted metal-dependent HD superfamily phosphohydrolase
MFDLQRWRRLWMTLGVGAGDPALFQQLQASYAQPWRAYHNMQHIQEALQHFDHAYSLAEQPAEVEVAIWFHDAIYDPKRPDNEVRSAEWAQQALLSRQIPPAKAQRVYDLILATQHDHSPTTTDAALLIDIDLVILGQPATRFAAYDQAIRLEYDWVPATTFRTRRCAVLQHFLDRTRIYQTDYFFVRLEQQARQNLAHAIAQLQKAGV